MSVNIALISRARPPTDYVEPTVNRTKRTGVNRRVTNVRHKLHDRSHRRSSIVDAHLVPRYHEARLVYLFGIARAAMCGFTLHRAIGRGLTGYGPATTIVIENNG